MGQPRPTGEPSDATWHASGWAAGKTEYGVQMTPPSPPRVQLHLQSGALCLLDHVVEGIAEKQEIKVGHDEHQVRGTHTDDVFQVTPEVVDAAGTQEIRNA